MLSKILYCELLDVLLAKPRHLYMSLDPAALWKIAECITRPGRGDHTRSLLRLFPRMTRHKRLLSSTLSSSKPSHTRATCAGFFAMKYCTSISSRALSPSSFSWNTWEIVFELHTVLSRHCIVRSSAMFFQNSPPHRSCVAFFVKANVFPVSAAPTAAMRTGSLRPGWSAASRSPSPTRLACDIAFSTPPVSASPRWAQLLHFVARHESNVDEDLVQVAHASVAAPGDAASIGTWLASSE